MRLHTTPKRVGLACAMSLLACGLLAEPALADEPADYTLTSWTTRDGLPSSYLLSLAQDRDGYLWVGTNAGLVRFDGQHFSAWPRTGVVPSPSTLINALLAARDGSLWVAAGTSIIHDQGGQLTVLPPVDGVTRSFVEDSEGTIWAAGTGGLARLTGNAWQRVPLPRAESLAVSALHEDRRHQLWAATGGRIYRQEHGTFQPLPVTTEGGVRFAERQDGMLVSSLATGLKVVALDGAGHATPVLSLRLTDQNAPIEWGRASWREQALPALVDRHGRFWLGTNGAGLLLIDLRTGRVLHRYRERDGLSGDLVRAVLEDRDGNIWVATHSGLTRVTPSSIRSVAVRPGSTAEDISTIERDAADGLWVEAPGALVHVSGGTRTAFTNGAGARFDRISAMHTDGDGVLWVATEDHRVVRRTRSGFEAVRLPEAFAAFPVTAIASSTDGRVWLYNGRILLLLTPDGAATTLVPPPAIRDNTVRFIVADRRGRLWIAADHGHLGRLDGTTFSVLTSEHGVPAGNASALLEDRSGRIWVSSDSGLSAVDGDRVRTLTSANGLPRNRMFFVTEDEQGRLWLGTSSGLVRVDTPELERALADPRYQMRLQLFDVSDGLRGTPVVRGYPTAARNSEGLWFVTSTGVAVISRQSQLREAFPSPVPRIEQVLVDGRPFTMGSPRLPGDLTSLQIEYAALNLTAPTKVRFRHQLDGVDPGWVDDGDTTRTVYAHLSSGTYRFRVGASAGDGRWAGEPAVWTFVVPPRWYESRLFYAAVAAGLALLVWGAWQLRVRQINRRFRDVIRERARVAREIHDTLLQSLVGMALQLDTVAHTEEPAGIREEVGRIRRQVQDAIGEAQRSISDLRTPRAESRDLVTRLRESAGPMLEHAGIRFDLTVTGTPRPLEPTVEQQLLRIGMEAVVNAMRHAQAGHVGMELSYERSTVRLRVTDDGHGFDPDAARADAGGHWGLSIMRERAEQLGGRFSIVSAPDRGTSIEVIAPGGAPA